ncbi:hypothetical protein FB45DRAFT_876153 [Roridomyces roridus]|uniref:Uncharacterized protein n=1 Tax=Roridomyces roridus TaxID=1738132 RepID=A0AAD7B4Y9_9AGAR|nr:hypothetical protein FB45DRAFT_876153 [Roridomyces roridus]
MSAFTIPAWPLASVHLPLLFLLGLAFAALLLCIRRFISLDSIEEEEEMEDMLPLVNRTSNSSSPREKLYERIMSDSGDVVLPVARPAAPTVPHRTRGRPSLPRLEPYESGAPASMARIVMARHMLTSNFPFADAHPICAVYTCTDLASVCALATAVTARAANRRIAPR